MTSGRDPRGVAQGWHTPRRRREKVAVFLSGGYFQNAIYEITTQFLIQVTNEQPMRVSPELPCL